MKARRQKSNRSDQVAVAYCRVSTQEQAERDLSLPAQLSAIRKYCEDKGYRLVNEYIEPGASGTDDNRPQFRKMIEEVLAPSSTVGLVLVHSTSRFMRDAYKARGAKQSLGKHGVGVTAVTQETSDDPMGQFMEGIFELVDEYESKINGLRTRAALRENAKNGWFCGSRAPYGFRVERVEIKPGLSRGRLVPDAAEAEILSELFRLYVAPGSGAKATARKLNQRGLLYRGRLWSKAQVLKCVDESAAVGSYFWGKKNSKSGRMYDRDEWIELKVDPIIGRELFDMTQQIRASRDPSDNPGRTGSSPMLLAGLVRCGTCGASYQLETSGKVAKNGVYSYRYYNCRSACRTGKEACEGFRIRAEQLEEAVLEHIAGKVFTEDRCRSILEEVVEESGALRQKTTKQRRLFRQELADIERRLQRWQEAFEAGDLGSSLGVFSSPDAPLVV